MSDTVLINFANTETVKELLTALDDRFNMQMASVTANNEAALFSVGGSVRVFDKTLDQLEQTYGVLIANKKHPADSTYLAAITKATPEEYKHVIMTQEQLVDQQNEMAKLLDGKIKSRELTPALLLAKLQEAFTNWKAMHTRQTEIGWTFPPRDPENHPYYQARGSGRGRGGRGRS
jgi:hypothetical protein